VIARTANQETTPKDCIAKWYFKQVHAKSSPLIQCLGCNGFGE